MKKKPLKFTAEVDISTADLTTRTISGTITLFDVPSSDGRIIQAGAITPREPLTRVKLLIDHDPAQPVGYMTELTQTATQADAVFYIPAGDAGDTALQSAQDGLRDGLSVGLIALADGYTVDDFGHLIVSAAEMYETSLVAIPAFQDAQVTNVAAALDASHKGENSMKTSAEIAAALAAGTITPAQAEQLLAGLAPARPVAPAEFTAGPELSPAPVAPAFTTPRPQSLDTVTRTVSAAMSTGNTQQILAALADVVPGDDLGKGYIGREDWLGQLWAATKTGRPWIDSFGVPRQLTSMKVKGWQWDIRPTPAKYLGNKTAVPSNQPKTKPVEADASRWAGGWDIDRIYIDLGDPAFLTDFWTAATLEYQLASDFDIAATILAAATEPLQVDGVTPLVDTTILGALVGAASSLRRIGANTDYVVLAEDLFEEYAALKITDLPAWLANAVGGVSLTQGTAAIGELSVRADEHMAAGTLAAYDKRAATVSEKSPFQVQALDVSRGGVDLGFYSYGGVIINDPRAIVLRSVA